ncbi:MAG: hypothetical protein U0905_02800 [Pirellulales bacterium]
MMRKMKWRWWGSSVGFSLLLLVGAFCTSAIGQEKYHLVVPNGAESSKAERSDQELMIRDSVGGVSRYVRDKRMDSADGLWLGYTSRAARQVIRWPVANHGKMQIGTPEAGGQIRYRESQMTIVPLADPTQTLPLPKIDDDPLDFDHLKPVPIRLASRADRQQFLSAMADGELSLMGLGARNAIDWTMVPVGNGLVRFQAMQGNQLVALRCDPRTKRLSIRAIGNEAAQLWRWYSSPQAAGAYLLESVMFPGYALSNQNGQMMLLPISMASYQYWYPVYPNIALAPAFKSVSTRVVPNTPLPPARIDFVNSHSDAIFVLLADVRASGQVETIRIPAGQRHQVMLDRDAGATIVETHEYLAPNGLWNRQEFTIPVPPTIYYDISVYDEILQSIAIDRTGKSPNPIEDINYQPKSLGWFLIPPGDALPEQGSLDLYQMAKDAKNPGAVRKIDQELLEKKKLPSEDPLRSILREFQSQRAAF